MSKCESMNQKDKQVWNRVVERRRQECASLDKVTVLKMLSPLVAGTGATSKSPSDLIQSVLNNHFDIASNPGATATDRRIAFEAIQRLRKNLDESIEKLKKFVPSLTDIRHSPGAQQVDAAAVAATTNMTQNTPLSIPEKNTTRNFASSTSSSGPSSLGISMRQTDSQNSTISTLASSTTPAPLPNTASETAILVATHRSPNPHVAAPSPAIVPPTINQAGTATIATATATHSPNRISSRFTPTSQSNDIINKTRSTITANLAAAAASTAQEAASSVEDPLRPSTTHTLFARQPPATAGVTAAVAVVPPPYQRRSDTVIGIEKANQTTRRVGSANSTSVAPISSHTAALAPPAITTTKKRIRETDNDDMETAENNEPQNTRPSQPTTPSLQEPPKKTPKVIHPTPSNYVMDPTTQVSKTQTVLEFPPDIKPNGEPRISCAQADRPAAKVAFRKHWPSSEMLRGAGRLFEVWEPYWQVEKVVASGVTSPIERLEFRTKPVPHKDVTNIPNTVTVFDLPNLTSKDFARVTWGTIKSQMTSKPKDGDCALLLRMLPIKRKPDEDKKRANTHIWPIGTFLMINKTPITITQRKQASHDSTKWEYLSHPLEISFHIKNPKESISISMCCQDSTQYFYMASVCSYKSPIALKDRLLQPSNPFLYSLSLEESSDKAMEYIAKNSMISIDDDEDGKENDDAGMLIFSLVDPVSKVLMKTPVRGQKCKHWQVRQPQPQLTHTTTFCC